MRVKGRGKSKESSAAGVCNGAVEMQMVTEEILSRNESARSEKLGWATA